jgi:hypothetical protein
MPNKIGRETHQAEGKQMRTNGRTKDFALNLRVGEIVEVRTKEEILRTLDENGKLDQLPFMPEMFKYCGKKFKVFKRADKTCDTIEKTGCRRMKDTVHLEECRCDGQSHGGCEAGCLLFWKEAWLRRVPATKVELSSERMQGKKPVCTLEALTKATTRCMADSSSSDGEEMFACQATELRKATSHLAWWDYRHYIRDILGGNRSVGGVLHVIFLELFGKALNLGGYRALIWAFNTVQRIRGCNPYPFRDGKLKRRTPSASLNLQPGEYVQVKSHDEILQTLNTNNKNRGLFFDIEMVRYCEGKFRVARKVHRIINEKTGKMMQLPNDCVILDGVICVGDYHQLCPRSIFPYWREIWLKRVDSV